MNAKLLLKMPFKHFENEIKHKLKKKKTTNSHLQFHQNHQIPVLYCIANNTDFQQLRAS